MARGGCGQKREREHKIENQEETEHVGGFEGVGGEKREGLLVGALLKK